MSGKFRVTYEIVTEESAAQGDAAERGYISAAFNLHWNTNEIDGTPDAVFDMTLRQAVNLMSCCEDSGRWFTESDARIDYLTGEHETRALHPPRNITESSYRRVARLLGAR